MVQVKICGNYENEHIRLINKYSPIIDYVGFIFTAKSKRYVKATKVATWIAEDERLRPKAVGVFLNQTMDEISEVIKETGIQSVQLHGLESPSFCSELNRKHRCSVWKAFSIPTKQKGTSFVDDTIQSITSYLPYIDVVLLDTKTNGTVGGTGMTFDWTIVPLIRSCIQQYNDLEHTSVQLFVAGGINASNVKNLINKQNQIDGIDLASGIETNGRKDEYKLKRLLKGADKI